MNDDDEDSDVDNGDLDDDDDNYNVSRKQGPVHLITLGSVHFEVYSLSIDLFTVRQKTQIYQIAANCKTRFCPIQNPFGLSPNTFDIISEQYVTEI